MVKVIYKESLTFEEFKLRVMQHADPDGIARKFLIRNCIIIECPAKNAKELDRLVTSFLSESIIKNCNFFTKRK